MEQTPCTANGPVGLDLAHMRAADALADQFGDID